LLYHVCLCISGCFVTRAKNNLNWLDFCAFTKVSVVECTFVVWNWEWKQHFRVKPRVTSSQLFIVFEGIVTNAINNCELVTLGLTRKCCFHSQFHTTNVHSTTDTFVKAQKSNQFKLFLARVTKHPLMHKHTWYNKHPCYSSHYEHRLN
jgi:hypothetical protein